METINLKEQIKKVLDANVSDEETLSLMEYIVSQTKRRQREKYAALNKKFFPKSPDEFVTSADYYP